MPKQGSQDATIKLSQADYLKWGAPDGIVQWKNP